MTSTQSAAFTSFLSQLRETGYGKGQGYDPTWFDRMSDAELSQAETLLIDELNRGEITAADALGGLATSIAIQALEQRLGQTPAPSRENAELARALWNATKDIKYQGIILDSLMVENKLERVAVVVGLLTTAHTTKLLDTCIGLAESDSYSSVRFTSAEGALHIVGLLPDMSIFNHPYRPLLIRIASEDTAVRGQALAEFRALMDSARANIALP